MAKKTISVSDLLDGTAKVEVISELSFEDGLKLLEELVSKVESGTLPLEQSIIAYERGSAIRDQLQGLLKKAEAKLQIIDPK